MNAYKLPSGKWRARVYNKLENTQKSFTADTKKEAERMARAYQYTIGKEIQVTVAEAMELYIQGRENILSVRTIDTYRSYQKQYYDKINHYKVENVKDSDLQLLVNDWARHLSPKYTKNIYGLLRSSLKYVLPTRVYAVKLPTIIKPKIELPNESDVKRLLEACEGTPLCTAIYLATFGALRRGEISALEMDCVDFNKKILHIDWNIVKNSNGEWIRKSPKNYEQATVNAPDIVFEKIKQYGLCELTPDEITKEFGKLLKKNGIPHFTIHGLRHYCASRMLSLGIPISYVQAYGRWKDQTILLKIYDYLIDEVRNQSQEKWNEYSCSAIN